MSQAGWYSDPTKTYMYRYWDGTQWTNQVNSGGATNTDPNPLDPTVAATPPAPGTEATKATAEPQPGVQVSQQSSGGGGGFFGALIGVLIAVVLVVGLFVMLSDSDSSTTTTAPSAPATTSAPVVTTAAP